MGKVLAKPARPTLTPAFVIGFCAWGACALAYTYAMNMSASDCLMAAAISLACLLAFAVIALVFRSRQMRLPAIALCAGALLAFSQAYGLHVDADYLKGTEAQVAITLLEDADASGAVSRALGSVELEHGRKARALIEFDDDERRLCGQGFQVNARFSDVARSSYDYAWRKGTLLKVRASKAAPVSRGGLAEFLVFIRARALERLWNQDYDTSVVQALSCGYRQTLKGMPEYAHYQSCGLAHMVAVSGAHLVIVTGLISSAFKRLRLPRRAVVCVLIGIMCAYVVLSGMTPSCIRASLMSSVGLLALFGKRRPSSLNALGLAVLAMIAVSPCASVSASLGLSALSTAGIVLFSPLVSAALEAYTPLRGGFARDALSLTFAAALPCQLYACSMFSVMPLISPFANVATAPLFPLACATSLAAALAGAFSLPLSGPACFVAACLTAALNGMVGFIASLPFTCVPVSIDAFPALSVSFVACAVAWVLWEHVLEARVVASLAAFAVALCLSATATLPFEGIAMLDVGQGDAFLISSRGKTLLVDTGNHDSQLLEQLAKCGVVHLDAVLVTHSDDDHCGSLDALQKAVKVDTLIVAEGMLKCDDPSCKALLSQGSKTARELKGVVAGDTIRIGSFCAEVLWPEAFSENGGNADSIVLLVGYDEDADGEIELSALFTGDAETDQLEQLIRSGKVAEVDVLKVGHHGSRNAMTAAQLETLDPKVALIGVGKGNRYGHPTPEITSMLDANGTTTFRSDIDSGVRLCIRGHALVARSL